MALSFLAPWLLLSLLALPAIWWLMRNLPPSPRRLEFPATRILKGIKGKEETPDHTPWWLLLIRMLAAGLLIFAFAEPIFNRDTPQISSAGPLVLVVDNGWGAAAHWTQRQRQAEALAAEAGRAGLSVVVVPTAREPHGAAPRLLPAHEASSVLAAMKPQPVMPRRLEAIAAVEPLLNNQPTPSVFWLADGLAGPDGAQTASKLKALGKGTAAVTAITPGSGGEALGLVSQLGAGGILEFRLLRNSGAARAVTVEALSGTGQSLAEMRVNLSPGAGSDVRSFEVPLELRNQIARLVVRGEPAAGAVQLLDSGSRWNRIGLVTGASRELAQPLLGPLYYIERALRPFAELSIADDNDVTAAMTRLAAGNASVLVLADVGKVTGAAREAMEKFLARGGILVRFAGPRLEEGGDDLLPVDLRTGGRSLGGALSWSTPQPLAAFEADSPFFGLKVTEDVKISRQVLADPALLADRTEIWARLADGTPLVTAQKSGKGRIVLFHVTANADWSNLPLSGLFVDMLRRITRQTGLAELDRGGLQSSGLAASSALTPALTLDGFGTLGPPPALAEPLPSTAPANFAPDATHPPGLYGTEGAVRAVNALSPADADALMAALPGMPPGVAVAGYKEEEAWPLRPTLLALALAMLLADMLGVLAVTWGGWRGAAGAGRSAATILMLSIALGAVSAPEPAQASDAAGDFALKAVSATRLAYVLTGDAIIDDTSKRGLASLTAILQQRTAVEPGEPMGVDVDKDELVFFQVVYWPVTKNAKALSEATRARVDAFMKGGGMVVFDTLDEGDRLVTLDARPGNEAFQRLAERLDIPVLEPVPAGHVLTKSFYLLKGFPGRYDASPLWVEAGGGSDIAADVNATPEARQSDGVSAVLVTGNDLAGAWAADDSGQGLNPVVPGGEEQREFAYRVGVNIVMYALTGNYKADQVHVPAILERLGQ